MYTTPLCVIVELNVVLLSSKYVEPRSNVTGSYKLPPGAPITKLSASLSINIELPKPALGTGFGLVIVCVYAYTLNPKSANAVPMVPGNTDRRLSSSAASMLITLMVNTPLADVAVILGMLADTIAEANPDTVLFGTAGTATGVF